MENLKLDLSHAGKPFLKPLSEIKAELLKSVSVLDVDAIRTMLRPDLEKQSDLVKDSLQLAYFIYDKPRDHFDLVLRGKMRSEWEGTTDKATVRVRQMEATNKKASDYPDLMKGATKFLRARGYDVNNRAVVKEILGMRFLIEFEDFPGEPGKVMAQLFYINAAGAKTMTPIVESGF